MTAREAIVGLCEEFQTELIGKDGNIKFAIKLREQWLKNNIKEEQMENFITKVLQTVKSEFKSLPSIATFEEILHPKQTKADIDDIEQLAITKFKEIVNKANYYADFQTNDMRIYQGLMNIGGWSGLCNSQKDDLKWLEKDFVKGFASVHRNGNYETETKTYRGIGTSGTVVFIGNSNNLQIEG